MSKSLDKLKEEMKEERRLLEAKLQVCENVIMLIERIENEEDEDKDNSAQVVMSSTEIVKLIFDSKEDGTMLSSSIIVHEVNEILEGGDYAVNTTRRPSQFVHGILYNLVEGKYLEKVTDDEDNIWFRKRIPVSYDDDLPF